ncbi:MAG: type II toxin-antitoxin system RelE/ParE family toxin [Deltaproteobacteria bacterium]|nr:type II toxin-antitoxin system RelE/ParE family toxin [Deltaproteobacteria bacterium]
MPAYQLVYTKRAAQDIAKPDRIVRKRLGKKLPDFANDPLKFAKRIHDPKLGNHRFRVGDYRIIFDIVGGQIVILRAGHRREIYR